MMAVCSPFSTAAAIRAAAFPYLSDKPDRASDFAVPDIKKIVALSYVNSPRDHNLRHHRRETVVRRQQVRRHFRQTRQNFHMFSAQGFSVVKRLSTAVFLLLLVTDIKFRHVG